MRTSVHAFVCACVFVCGRVSVSVFVYMLSSMCV